MIYSNEIINLWHGVRNESEISHPITRILNVLFFEVFGEKNAIPWLFLFFSFEYFFSLDKFQVVHDKQQHPSGPGGSFGYGGGGGGGGSRRMVRGGAYFPTSFV